MQNSWGGPDSAEKRDWLARAGSELLAATPDADSQYVEEFLLQVMNDEFDVNVEDGSGEEIADKILRIKLQIINGDTAPVDEMLAEWKRKQKRGGDELKMFVEGSANGQDAESGSDDSDDMDDEDEDMEDAPQLVKVKELPEPEIDEEGFTKVTRKKNR